MNRLWIAGWARVEAAWQFTIALLIVQYGFHRMNVGSVIGCGIGVGGWGLLQAWFGHRRKRPGNGSYKDSREEDDDDMTPQAKWVLESILEEEGQQAGGDR